jgi:hypothetical protein
MIQFRGKDLSLPSHPLSAYALAAAPVVLLAGLVFPAHASATTAPVVPATASGCNTASLDQWHNCTTVTGSGLKITSISGYGVSEVDGTLSNLHVEIYGPNGLIKNCGTFSIPGMGDTGPICSWTNPKPSTNQTAGDYCTITWQYEGGTTYKSGGAECIGVHS